MTIRNNKASTAKNQNKADKKKSKRLKSDGLVKKIMAEKIAAYEFLDNYLPAKLKEMLDLNQIEVEAESFVEESLRKQLSDIIYKIKTKTNEEAFVYVLLESQSSIDHKIAWRLWKYTLLLLERHLKDKGKLPIVAPFVLYHGKGKYNAAKSLWEMFAYPEIAKELMGDKYLLVDLQTKNNDEIKRKQHLGMLEFFLKNIHTRDMLNLWHKFFANFQDMIVLDKENGYLYIRSFLYYTDAKVADDRKDELNKLIIDHIQKEDGEKLMYTIADSYRDEGLAKGIEIGKFEEKAAMVKAMLFKNYPISEISSITGLDLDTIGKLRK